MILSDFLAALLVSLVDDAAWKFWRGSVGRQNLHGYIVVGMPAAAHASTCTYCVQWDLVVTTV